MKHTPFTAKLNELLTPTIEDMGFDLVRIRLNSQRGEQVLQIMAEPKDKRQMTVEDCAQISRRVSAVLDVEDVIASAYRLEISSPGIDRPLVREQDFADYVGHEAQIEMEWAVEGRKRYKGEILGVSGGVVQLKLDEQHHAELEINGMQSAKLVLTDKLIKQAMERT